MMVSQQARILSLCLCSAATLSTSDAFSLVQKAAASQQSRDREGGNGNGNGSNDAGPGASASATSTNRPSGARRSASAASRSPFGSSLGRRAGRSTVGLRNPQSAPGMDDFSLRMSSQTELEEPDELIGEETQPSRSSDQSSSCSNDCNADVSSSQSSPSFIDEDLDFQQRKQLQERRKFLHGLVTSTAAFATASVATSSTVDPTPFASTLPSQSASSHVASTAVTATTSHIYPPFLQTQPAYAFDRTFPTELEYKPSEAETSSTSISKLKEERISVQKAKIKQTKEEFRTDPFGMTGLTQQSQRSNNALEDGDNNIGLTVAGGMVWALALWFVSGSRSNPLVTPLANIFYDEGKEEWLKDRNEGFFGDVPPPFLGVLTTIFIFLGVVADRAVYFLTDGDAAVSLQLAGVSAISGAFWEVGRIAAGEKGATREEFERDAELKREFEEFAEKRIVVGKGNCHRSDVISAFRRFNPKYRVADSEQYPLADIEIERILRKWNREKGSGGEMSSAGFFSGISINEAADAFAPR
ncbi:hypothetical protein ACHAXS_012189 [Conticribra weissflogii]